MRTLADIFGMLVFAAGLLCFFLSCVGPTHAANPMLFWAGIALMAGGVVVCHGANRKTCPQCAERVKYEAKKCRHCGHEFAAAARASVSEPYYK